MASAAEQPCLILYHVPKTAGTMVMRWLRSHDLAVWSYTNQQLNSSAPNDGTPAVDLHSARVYIGHVAPASAVGGFRDFLRERGVTKSCAEWTILRRPVPRVLSAARYATRWSSPAQSAAASIRACGGRVCEVSLHASLRAVPRGGRGRAPLGAQPPPR